MPRLYRHSGSSYAWAATRFRRSQPARNSSTASRSPRTRTILSCWSYFRGSPMCCRLPTAATSHRYRLRRMRPAFRRFSWITTIAIAAPEEVAGIRLGAWRNVFERLLELYPHLFGFSPLSGLGALSKVIPVHLPAHPFGAIAPAAGAVVSEFAVGRMAGKDGKQHGAPHFRGEFARMEEVGQNGGNVQITYKNAPQICLWKVCR